MFRSASMTLSVAAGVLLAGLAACEPSDAPLAPIDGMPLLGVVPSHAASNQGLAALRNLTAPFHRLEAAMDAGWSVPLTPCLEHPTEGGMGFHYANLALFDGTAEVLEPEALVYAPWRDGDLRLVAVEYIVPFLAWEGDDPPELLGQQFHRNEEVGIWALHVWLWQHNPSGMFADWNPRISCDGSP